MVKIRQTAETVLLVISLGMYIFDVVTDIILAISFHVNGDAWYFSLTLTFILLSAIISNFYSVVVSLIDLLCKSKFACIVSVIIHCCLLGVAYTYIMGIFCGVSRTDDFPIIISSRSSGLFKRRPISAARAKHRRDFPITIVALGLTEILFEACPQLILQLYIIIANTQVIRPEFQTDDHVGISKRNTTAIVAEGDFFQKLTSTTMMFQTLSIVTSLTAIAWVLTKWSKTANVRSWVADVCYFIWHVFSVGAHIFAIALFASVFTFWTPVVILCRFIIFGVYMILSSSHSFGLFLVVRKMLYTLIYTFSYFGDDDREPSRKEYLVYFVYELVENSILVGLWSWVIDSEVNTFRYFGLIIEFSSVGISFICMGIYLLFFHKDAPLRRKKPAIVAETEVEMRRLNQT